MNDANGGRQRALSKHNRIKVKEKLVERYYKDRVLGCHRDGPQRTAILRLVHVASAVDHETFFNLCCFFSVEFWARRHGGTKSLLS